MSGIFYLAYRYLCYYHWKTLILLAAITLVIYLPAALQLMLNQTADQMMSRAQSSPLLVGAKGSPLELVLSSLYFQPKTPPDLPYKTLKDIRASGLADAIPLYVRFHTRGFPVVGTSLEYFEFRQLQLAQGRAMALLGEAVVGAKVAAELGLSLGDSIITTAENIFDLAGVYPLKMPVVGILSPSFSADDGAVFVDIKTSWVIQGIGHGHQDLNTAEAVQKVLKKDGANIVANAALVQYNEITTANINSFHLHGSKDDLPITAVIPVAKDSKSSVLLQGRFEAGEFAQQILRPATITRELLDTIFTAKHYVLIAMSMVAASTVLVVVLVFSLSLRIRRDEIATMIHIGGSKSVIFSLLSVEVVMILSLSAVIAALLTLLTEHYGVKLLQSLITG